MWAFGPVFDRDERLMLDADQVAEIFLTRYGKADLRLMDEPELQRLLGKYRAWLDKQQETDFDDLDHMAKTDEVRCVVCFDWFEPRKTGVTRCDSCYADCLRGYAAEQKGDEMREREL
tara:strand:- start:148 stop:501 length:354 start_codon:yes stop_codon:yes gene_type:complete